VTPARTGERRTGTLGVKRVIVVSRSMLDLSQELVSGNYVQIPRSIELCNSNSGQELAVFNRKTSRNSDRLACKSRLKNHEDLELWGPY
jgi:hypothetical protein